MKNILIRTYVFGTLQKEIYVKVNKYLLLRAEIINLI